MSLTNNLGAYEDCVKIFDMALQSKTGIRIRAPTSGDANHMFSRLNYTRKLLREQSMGNLPSDHPEFNTSQYDVLIVRRPREVEEQWWIYIEPREVTWAVEELPDANTTT